MVAREVEDKDSGKHLSLNHLGWSGLTVPPAIDSAPTTTMILLFEHPAAAGPVLFPIKAEDRFIVGVLDLPPSLESDFRTSRNLFSIGFDEVGLLIAGRRLEGVLRKIASLLARLSWR